MGQKNSAPKFIESTDAYNVYDKEFKLDGSYNFIKQQTTECGFPSPQKILSLREIIDKKVLYKKEIGVYIYRKENWRQIRNSDDVLNVIKKKFNSFEYNSQ